jgi:hypothetical protein
VLPQEFHESAIAVEKFVADDIGLCFLTIINPGPRPRAEKAIILLNRDGAYQRMVKLAEDPNERGRSILHLGVDANGNLFLVEAVKPQTVGMKWRHQITIHNRHRGRSKTILLEDLPQSFCIKGRFLCLLSHNNQLTLMGDDNPRSALRISLFGLDPLADLFPKMCPLPGDRVALVDGVLAKLHIINHSTGRSKAMDLGRIAEIRRGLETYAVESRGAATEMTKSFGRAEIVTAATTTPQGNLYLRVSGHPMAHGEVILRMNSDLRLVESLRCMLPRLESLKCAANPEGYMAPSKFMGLTSDRLFLATGAGEVAWKQLV